MAEVTNAPPEMQFAIDCLPTIQLVLKNKTREDIIDFLDFGLGFSASANLFATLNSSNFLQCKFNLSALDHKNLHKELAELNYPRVNYIVGDIHAMEDKKWNIVYCCNMLEHIENPTQLIDV
ncbi:methyltransferase domain-containing protein [Aeromonas caviae]|uniref:methyltransferase domain-containing protein n=1 Tax=Aeromonas TaxID=642 RepID=UPI0022E5FC9C|nr:class I SAM-dependent methyltransferase [Aeromonas sp. QDB66]